MPAASSTGTSAPAGIPRRPTSAIVSPFTSTSASTSARRRASTSWPFRITSMAASPRRSGLGHGANVHAHDLSIDDVVDMLDHLVADDGAGEVADDLVDVDHEPARGVGLD